RLSLLSFFFQRHRDHRPLHSFPTRRSSDLTFAYYVVRRPDFLDLSMHFLAAASRTERAQPALPSPSIRAASSTTACWASVSGTRSEEHTSELQSLRHLVCRLLLEKKKKNEL